jgi:hypothetical protein
MSAPTSIPDSPAVRRTTVAAVLLVAAVAAVVSYAHMQHVAHREGEAWRSFLLPLSVDGLMVAASMVLLHRRRAGLGGGTLPWAALLAGVAASLAANVAAAEPTTTARIVAAWPAVAFAVAFELLLQQRHPPIPGDVRSDLPPAPRASIPPGPGTSGEDFALAARAADVLAKADGRPPGRRVLARELGCTEHRARVLLDALSANGTGPVEGSEPS